MDWWIVCKISTFGLRICTIASILNAWAEHSMYMYNKIIPINVNRVTSYDNLSMLSGLFESVSIMLFSEASGGLHLILDAQVYEYIAGVNSGFRIRVHDPRIPLRKLTGKGILIPTGRHTKVTLRKKEVSERFWMIIHQFRSTFITLRCSVLTVHVHDLLCAVTHGSQYVTKVEWARFEPPNQVITSWGLNGAKSLS